MPKKPDERVGVAEAMFRQGVTLVDIAKELDLPAGTVRRWKSTYEWEPDDKKGRKKCSERSDKKMKKGCERSDKKSERSETGKKKRGGQPGNHNGKGAPPGNKRAEKYGFFSRYLPEDTREIVEEMQDADPAELLWHQIQLAYAAILRAQNIFASNAKTKGNQQAFTAFMIAQSKAQAEMNKMIQRYEAMTVDVDEERQLRLDTQRLKLEEQQLKLEEQKLRYELFKKENSEEEKEETEDSFLKALEGSALEDWSDEETEDEVQI